MDALAVTSVLARGGRFIRDLINGDPVAWTILGVVVVGMIAWALIKKRMNRSETPGGNVQRSAEQNQTEGDAGRRS